MTNTNRQPNRVGLRIGELAKRANVTPRTIRFYVQEGLLPKPLVRQKNMAYYSEDLVEKIQIIKRAQKERFLPLVVIQSILEENNYDYGVLERKIAEGRGGGCKPAEAAAQVTNGIAPDIPSEILNVISRQRWGCHGLDDSGNETFTHDPSLLHVLSALHRAGVPWDELVKRLKAFQRGVGTAIEKEFQILIDPLIKNPEKGFAKVLRMEETAIANLIWSIRRKQLKNIANRYKRYMDNAYRASADEGFAVPPEEILPELARLQRRLSGQEGDLRILNDLSIGYSCAGKLDQALRCLNKVLKKYPEALETKVRWFWYKRFSGRPGEALRLKQQLVELVEDHPEHAFARAFLAMWHFSDVSAFDDHGRILETLNLSMGQLDAAEKGWTADLHEWMVVRYFKGRILTALHFPGEYLQIGIEAFHRVLEKKEALDALYARRMPFYGKWLWPNLYFFLASACLRCGRYDEALATLEQAESYRMMYPYKERLLQCREEAQRKSERGL